jgi:hypothetical protein
MESIKKVQPPQSKNDMQKFLRELNYLRRFIFSLSGKISAFAPILRLKNEDGFTWGAEQYKIVSLFSAHLGSISGLNLG